MIPKTFSALFAYVVTCLFTVTIGTNYPPIIYLNDYCGLEYTVKSDVRIKLSKSTYLPQNNLCTMTVAPTNGSILVARFLAYNMKTAYVNELGYCAVESIQLYKSDGSSVISSNEDFCSALRPPYQYKLGVTGEFRYTTKAATARIYAPTVDLLISEVIPKEPSSSSSCPSGYFDCHNYYCVNEDVTCNGYDDCGNNRDEIEGCGLTPGIIAGIVIGVIIFTAIVVTAFLMFRRQRRRAVYVRYY